MAEIETDVGPALILETTLSENDMRTLQIWLQEVLELERERCVKIVEEAISGKSEIDICGIIRAIRLVG